MPSHESALVTAAKRLARAQMKRRKARKALREIEAEIKLARKFLRASMVSALNAPEPAYCEIHQSFGWCEHNGGIRGATGFEAPPSNQPPPRNGRQIRRRQK